MRDHKNDTFSAFKFMLFFLRVFFLEILSLCCKNSGVKVLHFETKGKKVIFYPSDRVLHGPDADPRPICLLCCQMSAEKQGEF
jgi:hypothetical protein